MRDGAERPKGPLLLHCPSCDRSFATGDRCPIDGTELVRLGAGSDPLIGRNLGGRFELRERLGSGGMGSVYVAWQHSIGREVAVKVIRPELGGDPLAARRFLREAKLASRISQPNVVVVLDFGQAEDGLLFLAMELVRGRTLAEVLRDDGPFPLARLVRVGAQLCDALEGAHRLGVVHRDLKPLNVLVLDDPRDFVKVCDFGLARSLAYDDAGATRSGVAGTPAYMAPEILAGGDADAASDLYSLGVVLHELAVGRRPHGEATESSRSTAPHAASSPSLALASLPEGLDRLILQLLEPEPGRRPTSAAEVRRALDALDPQRSGEMATVTPVPASTPAAPMPPGRRLSRRAVVVGVAVAVTGAAAATVLVARRSGQAIGPSVRLTWSPYRDQRFLQEHLAWLRSALSQRIGRPVELVPAGSYDDAINQAVRGAVDMAGLSPASYVAAKRRQPGLVLLARVESRGAATYQSILFTRASSPVHKIEDIRGKSICLVDRNSTSGYVVPRALLRRAGIDPDHGLGEVVLAGDHQRAAAMLADGRCDVAGTSSSALTQWAEEAGLSTGLFRIVVASDAIPGEALVAAAGRDPALLDDLRQAVEHLMIRTAAREIPIASEISGLRPGDDRDYDGVRGLLDEGAGP